MGIGRLDAGRFNLILSVRHNADASRVDEWRASFQRASELLFDATDGQHQLGTLYVCNDSSGGRNADAWLLQEDGRSSAGGLGALGTETTHMTLYGDERHKPFVVLHELVHYLYGPADEYSGSAGDAECIGAGPPNDACVMERGWWEGDRFGNDATGGALVTGAFNELCVASNHDSDGDTYQDSIWGQSCWQTMVASFPGLTGPAGIPAGPAPAGASAINWVLLAPDERFILALDRSGSMQGEKFADAQFGATWWALQALAGERLGVVSYATGASTNFPLQQITGQADRDSAAAAVAALASGGATAMGDAMRRALDEFMGLGVRAGTQVLVLLTDGNTNAGEAPSAVLPDLVANGVRVYTIGIGGDVNSALLEQIATTTGGAFYRIGPATTTLSTQDIIRNVLIEISGIARDGGGVVTTAPEKLDPDGRAEAKVYIEEGSELATFGISYPATKAMLMLELESPEGQVIAPWDIPPEAREIGTRVPWSAFHVEKPAPGWWTMRVVREFGEPGLPFHRFVFSRNRSIDGGLVVPRRHKPGAKIPILFQLYHQAPLDQVEITASVHLPDGSIQDLHFESIGTDNSCVTGLYQAWFESSPKAEGAHWVRVQARASGAVRAVGGELVGRDEQVELGVVPEFERSFDATFLVGREHVRRFEIDPERGSPGDKVKIHFTGYGTGWYQDGTRVGFGDGITVHELVIEGPESMVAVVDIDRDASPGPRGVVVSTPRREGTLSLDEGFVLTGRDLPWRPRFPVTGIRFDGFGRLRGVLTADGIIGASDDGATRVLGLLRDGASVTVTVNDRDEIEDIDAS